MNKLEIQPVVITWNGRKVSEMEKPEVMEVIVWLAAENQRLTNELQEKSSLMFGGKAA